LTYDPGFLNTASCRSAITYIDGDKGILRYRGYPSISSPRTRRTSRSPTSSSTASCRRRRSSISSRTTITHHTFVHENVRTFIDGFRYDAHPMGMLVATVCALSTFYPGAKHVGDADIRRAQMVRLIAQDADGSRPLELPALAWAMPCVYPVERDELLRELPLHD
jgi:citrate synthase